MRFVAEISYLGSAYFGWQMQAHHVSVQSVIEKSWSELLQMEVKVTGCGRTDTGVHAAQYFLHVDLMDPPMDRMNVKTLNSVLPDDIAVRKLWKTLSSFHVRFDANYRKYIYTLHVEKDPFRLHNSFYYPQGKLFLTIDKLNEASNTFLHYTEFKSFCKAHSGLQNFICQIHQSEWYLKENLIFEFHVASNRFLRGMVRLMVGTCLNYCSGKISLEQIHTDLSTYQQIQHSWSVPAKGLNLVCVNYPQEKNDHLILI